MNEVSAEIEVQVAPQKAWEILSDLTAMQNYMPGLSEVRLTSESSGGLGAERHCRFDDGVELTERVVEWNPEKDYTLETTAFKGVPMRTNVITFSLRGDGDQTTLTQTMRYEMKGWLLAPIMERMAAGMMRKALNGALSGFKQYAEG